MNLETMNIGEVAEAVHAMALEKGFGETPVNIDQKLLLAVGEIIEAQEELRKGWSAYDIYTYLNEGYGPETVMRGLDDLGPEEKPEGFAIEIADALIRLLQLCAALGIDIQTAMEAKINYNATRPYKHGKKF